MKTVCLPVPYPGECLYSVFCRYHVRSGNTPTQTATELYGYNMTSFAGAVVSPSVLFRPDRQHLEVRGMRTTDLVMRSTAFQYFSLTLWPQQYDYMSTILDTKPRRHYRMPTFISQTQASQKKGKNLFYCPACAQEERRIYGEPFWHTLHQLHGVEYCQIHQIPLEESEADIRHKGGIRFYPAYIFAKGKSECKDAGFNYKSEFIKIAEDINWLLNNGWRLGGINRIKKSYINRVLSNHKDPNIIGMRTDAYDVNLYREADEDYLDSLPQGFLEKLCLPPEYNFPANHPYSFLWFTPLQHVVYMRGHFGGAMEFFKQGY